MVSVIPPLSEIEKHLKIKIPPWEALAKKFGLDSDGNIGNIDTLYWTKYDETQLDADRLIKISEFPDDDGDYAILKPVLTIDWVLKDLYQFTQDYNISYGISKSLGVPHDN